MKKKRAIFNFILLTILVMIFLVFSFISVRVPTTNYIFKGFLNGIPSGIEYDGGVMAIYDVETLSEEDNLDNAIESAMSRVYDLLSKNYNEPLVYRYGDQIKVVVPDETINRNYLVGFVEFSTEQVSKDSGFEAKLTGEHIKSAQYMSSNGTSSVYIEFNEEGKEILEELTSSATQTAPVTLYVYVDQVYDESSSSPAYYSAVKLGAPIENGYIQLSGGSSIQTKDAATAFANKIESGKLGINMVMDGEENIVEPTLNKATIIISEIGLLLIIAGTIAYLIAKYKELGLVSSLSMMIFAVLSTILLSLIPIIELSVSTLAGVIVSYLAMFVAIVLNNENIKKEYANGKKFIPSFKSGYVKSLPLMIDIFATMLGFGVIGIFLATGALKGFVNVLLLTSLVGAFVGMLIHRMVCKIYLNINFYNEKKVNFKKAEQVNEK